MSKFESLPEGWNSLDDLPDEADPVQGLLSNGRIAHAEWWGPVPEELWDAAGDGSGWGFAMDLSELGEDVSLIAWRHFPPSEKPVMDNEPPW